MGCSTGDGPPPSTPGREGGCGHRAKFGGGAEGGRHPLFRCGWGIPRVPRGCCPPWGTCGRREGRGRRAAVAFWGHPGDTFPGVPTPRVGSPRRFLGAPGTAERVPVGHGGQAGSADSLPSPLRPPVFSNWGNWSYWEEFSGCCALGPPPSSRRMLVGWGNSCSHPNKLGATWGRFSGSPFRAAFVFANLQLPESGDCSALRSAGLSQQGAFEGEAGKGDPCNPGGCRHGPPRSILQLSGVFRAPAGDFGVGEEAQRGSSEEGSGARPAPCAGEAYL